MRGFKDEHPQERRAHPRYPVKLALRFLIRAGRVMSVCGEGTSVNISSTGMLFRSSKRLNQAEKIISAVQWPSSEGKPLFLLFHGHVVWMKGSLIGMSISHYGFFPEEIPDAIGEQTFDELTHPRRLTPTRPNPELYAGVRQWRRSDPQWK